MASSISIFEWTRQYYSKNSGIEFHYFEEINSTNDIAKKFFNSRSLMIFLAKRQTSGRGQFGRIWLNASQEEGAVLISYSYPLARVSPPHLSLELGYGLKETLKTIWDLPDLMVKSPNDLYRGSYKVAGFLCELISQRNNHQLIIGLGLNVFSYPDELEHARALMNKHDLNEKQWFEFLKLWDRTRNDIIRTYL